MTSAFENLCGPGKALRDEASLAVLTEDVVQTSAIEGETLNVASVRSSVARRLGVDIGALAPADRHVDGIVDMVLDATGNATSPLTTERLFGWHAALFPTGYSGISQIRTGQWRDDATGPMQVISGSVGREKIHFEAPPARRLDAEMAHISVDQVLAKAKFWQRAATIPMNERQIKVLNRLLDGFEGKLTTRQWAAIAKCSQDTALRDITELLQHNVLQKTAAGGRSTHYEVRHLDGRQAT